MEETRPEKSNSASLYIIGLIVLIAVAAGTYFIFQDTQNSKTENQEEVTQEESDETIEETETMETEESMTDTVEEGPMEGEMSQEDELTNKILIYRSYVIEIEPVLSDEGLVALEVVTEYIDQDRSVLLNDISTYPQEVQDAIAVVKSEADQKLGTIAIKQPELKESDDADSMNDEAMNKDSEDAMMEDKSSNEKVGQVASGQGILEIKETGEENPFGTIYKLTNEEDGNTYYFLFGNSRADKANELVGKLVDIEVKITEIDEENNLVAYDVISGPTLVVEEAEETE